MSNDLITSDYNEHIFFQPTQLSAKRRTDTSRIILTRRIVPCTTCAKEKESTTCRVQATSCSIPMRMCVTGQKEWKVACTTHRRLLQRAGGRLPAILVC